MIKDKNLSLQRLNFLCERHAQLTDLRVKYESATLQLWDTFTEIAPLTASFDIVAATYMVGAIQMGNIHINEMKHLIEAERSLRAMLEDNYADHCRVEIAARMRISGWVPAARAPGERDTFTKYEE